MRQRRSRAVAGVVGGSVSWRAVTVVVSHISRGSLGLGDPAPAYAAQACGHGVRAEWALYVMGGDGSNKLRVLR